MRPPRVLVNTSLIILAAGTVALGVSACSPPANAGSSASSPMSMGSSPMDMGSETAGLTIHIKGHAYTAVGSAAPGARVTVMNMDTEAHTVTADDGSFDVTVPAGQSTSFAAPAKPGTFAYHCKYHADMTGTLVVG